MEDINVKKKRNRKIKNIIIDIIIFILLLTSIVLIFKNQIREYFTSNMNNKIITAYQNNKGEVDIPWWQKIFTDTNSKIELTDSMIGILKIDNIKLQEPIFQGDSEINLINGVATVDKDQTLDAQNVSLAGHSVQGVDIRFYNLNKVNIGDEVQIISKDKLRKYKITKTYVVEDTRVEILDQHPGETHKITMFTCTGYNNRTGIWEKRFVVEAELTGEESA